MHGYDETVAAPPPPATPPPPRPAARFGALGYVLVGAIVGGLAGGGVGAAIVSRGGPPAAAPSAAATATLPAETGPVQRITVQESSATVDAVRDVLPAVVTVLNEQRNGTPQSSGSGVIVDRERGYIVTNSHVVEDIRSTDPAPRFEVILSDGKKVAATLVGHDSPTDVAVLKASGALPAQATLADSSQVQLGAAVVAIGSPGGGQVAGSTSPILFENTVTNGIVSAKGRRLPREDLPDTVLEDLVQTNAAINPGNSGGPLVWVSTKQVIGLNTLVVRGQGEQGLGFAISSNTVRKIADELIAHGTVERGVLGIRYDDNSPQYAAYYGLSTSDGIVVLQVLAGGPAAAAGLQRLDVVTKIDGQAIDATHPVRNLLLDRRPGDRVTLTVVRAGKEETVAVTLGASTSLATSAAVA